MATSIRSRAGDVLGLPFAQFQRVFANRWNPGQHVAAVGPTGCGKSTAVCHLLTARKYVIALDPKGGDSTIGALERRAGFQRVSQWPPPRKILGQIERGEPTRLIVGTRLRTPADRPKLRGLLADTIGGVFEQGGWTMYVDELQIAADRRLMNLTGGIEECLIAARDRGVSVVTSFQRPANVPRSASEMSTYLWVWYTRDRDTVDRIAHMMGRPKEEVRGAMSALGPFDVMVVSNNPHDPMMFTNVPPF